MAVVAIVLQANVILRRAFYETFLHMHIALIIVLIVGLWKHLDGLPQQNLLLYMILLWALEVCLVPVFILTIY